MPTLHVFDYLDAPDRHAPTPLTVAFGSESFLSRLVLPRLRDAVLGPGDVPYATFDGESAEWRDVIDEVSTVSLFGGSGRRLAIVEQADKFVSAYRSQLEDYAERPSSRGVLVLVVDTWASNTRLYKSIEANGLQIACRAPERVRGKSKSIDEARIGKWLVSWSQSRHQFRLQSAAAELLLELVGPNFGLLEQELSKLALYAGIGGQATPEMVRDHVGGWRTKTMWELLDVAADGDAVASLEQLAKLLDAGENEIGLMAQITWFLRRFAVATRIIEREERAGRRPQLLAALEQAGFKKWPAGALERAEKQLLQLGRERAGQLFRWLHEADLALKGSHSAPGRARLVLERLLIRISKPFAPPKRPPARRA